LYGGGSSIGVEGDGDNKSSDGIGGQG